MITLIAPCGLDCAKCEAYTLTQANDQAGLEVLLAKWKVEFNAPDMTIKDVTCDGCLAASGKVGGYCSMCEIRKCAQEKSLATCAGCQEYACEKLEGFFQMAPPAKENLEAIRRSM
jgi:hypothetical protein